MKLSVTKKKLKSNQEATSYYYTQAAGKDENPFLTDDASLTQVDAQQTLLAGDKARSGHVRTAGPPARPPPPKSRNSSPAPVALIKPPPKSAFDDLDVSIREAFGGSPSKSFPLKGGNGAVGSQAPNQSVAGSSSQHHAFAPNTHMFASPVKGVANVNSVAAIGGGSL